METQKLIQDIEAAGQIRIIGHQQPYPDELYLTVDAGAFAKTCLFLHKRLNSPVMAMFARDLRADQKAFEVSCVFLDCRLRSWVTVTQKIPQEAPSFTSLAREIYSSSMFEREIKEMFGIEPAGHPDPRRLRLHDEVWPGGAFPLRKDAVCPKEKSAGLSDYQFKKVKGEGIFEIPVGPVHAGVIGPGHFRFSAAGEPIINLEIRLGWTHRGIEKLLEGKRPAQALGIFECISGDTAFGYGLSFCESVEKILKADVSGRSKLLRAVFLELERIYNHANDIGGMALDVGFSFPAQYASLIKESILQLNERLCGSRFLKGVNRIGGVGLDLGAEMRGLVREALGKIEKDMLQLEGMLYSSTSFMDRVDSTGILRTKTARDLGITGLAARASAIPTDMRKILPGIYNGLSFNLIKEHTGDVLARLKARFDEVKESSCLIKQCLGLLEKEAGAASAVFKEDAEGFGIGCVEAWRGPVFVWTALNKEGVIERCKIVDPSFRNWEALSFAVLGNIVPDFPLCNKSFDLSYSGNDL